MTKAVNFAFDVAGISGVTGVKLAGEFNSWNGEAMTAPVSGTVWTLTKNLTAGAKYAYKFIVTDSNGDKWYFDQNGFRGKLVSDVENSYVDVPAPGYAQVFFLAAGTHNNISNTAAETSLISAAGAGNQCVIPANTLKKANLLRLTIVGNFQSQADPNGKVWLRLKLGSAKGVPDYLAVEIENFPVTSIFKIIAEIAITNDAGVGSDSIMGNLIAFCSKGDQTGTQSLISAVATVVDNGGGALDFTADNILDCTVQWATANANNRFTPYFVIAELLTPPSS